MSTLTQFFGCGAAETVVCDLVLVGGGGGGGTGSSAFGTCSGAGGSGQLLSYNKASFDKGVTYTIVVGAGGAADSFGSESSFGLITAYGGAGGAVYNVIPTGTVYGFAGGGASGGAGPAVPGSAGGGLMSGFTGFAGYSATGYDPGSSKANATGGGGGSGGPGIDAPANATAGAGGPGTPIIITGSSVTYAAGGAGRAYNTSGAGVNGGANTGDGGSSIGSFSITGASGGSGIVIIAYPNTYAAPSAITGTYTTPTRSGYRVYQFTASGSITF